MRKLSLDEIQNIELQILKNLDKFCREKDIRYYLSNGTLLGAIKYKGFIPWDDDIDVLIPRDDYNKLLKEYRDNSTYWLVDSNKYAEYPFPFAKLCDKDTEIKNACTLQGKQMGIHIDIFPIDNLPYNKIKRIYLMQKRKFVGIMLGFSLVSFIPGKTLLRSVIKFCLWIISKICGYRLLKKILDRDCVESRNGVSSAYVGCVAWPIYGVKEIMHSDIFNKSVEVEFEDEKFWAPHGYDTYLRKLYGEYKFDPPIDKQKSHHKIEAYKKS